MKINYLYILLVLIVIMGCKKNQDDFNFDEIDHLQTTDARKSFLEAIYDTDQEIRKRKSTLHTHENKKLAEDMLKIDELNLQKIEAYLQIHGHPSLHLYGEKACSVPWLIIHHSSTISTRERWFPELYKAYIDGDLKPSQFSLYLFRYHSIRYNKSFSMPSPYKEKDYIDSLLKALNKNINDN